MLDYVRFLKIGPTDCDVWGFPIEIRMMDLHTKYLLLVAAYVLSYSPRQAHGAALGSYVVPRQYFIKHHVLRNFRSEISSESYTMNSKRHTAKK